MKIIDPMTCTIVGPHSSSKENLREGKRSVEEENFEESF